MPMSVSAYGRRIGVSHEAVRRAIQSGRLSQSIIIDGKGHPKIADPDLADHEWGENTRESKQMDWGEVGDRVSASKGGDGKSRSPNTKNPEQAKRSGRGSQSAGPADQGGDPEPPEEPGDTGGGTGSGGGGGAPAGGGALGINGASPLNKAKAARETYEARMAELRYRKMKEELVDAAEVRREFRDAGRRVRDGLLAIPDRVMAILAAETDPEKIRTTLVEEIEQTLKILADTRGESDG